MSKENEGLLSRWSRRKLDADDAVAEMAKESAPKEHDESSWQQKDVDSEDKQSALSALFRQPEFHDVDQMNEYDEDFTQFSGLGDIVTQEMKRMVRVVEERTRPEDVRIATDESSSIEGESPENKEDNEIA